jgi:hypothetical protein
VSTTERVDDAVANLMAAGSEHVVQAAAFELAAEVSPLRQVRAEMRRRAKEWRDAIDLAADAGDDAYEIDLAGSIVPGDRVVAYVQVPWSQDLEREALPVLRVLHRDGQSSIHVTSPHGRDLYLNYAGPPSPVVVQR